ncbi:hypoxanthine phosphoribosyltransferase [Fibrobacter sp. UWB11]|uniref:hypoxanthine phosphoribosyltransferase n=1 Tax=Fibrobacter sp. UWB11 TaxID=1896202 RepID=UPI00092BE43F|nr:hypoxanthine phosphoribosyltransferase [Fibrobacter sp. UWB11]SIO25678.1 hypoxanthine phosphoribosyltransferase [Fibrobacter sp. UWB11]
MYKLSNAPLLNAPQIDKRLESLAQELKACDFDIILSALTGSYIFTADLSRRIATPKLRIAFIKASSYGESDQPNANVHISGLEGLDIKGKRVLLIDDILDTGNTMYSLVKALADYSPASIKTCVLLNKESRRTVDYHADFVGFEIENKFVVGYGLDYANDYRTLPEIWTLEEV